jgi:hypothetical protein
MATRHQDLKNLIRDGVRATIHNTLSSVIQEVREEELRDPAFQDPLMQVIRLELQRAIEDLHSNGDKPPSQTRK